ncbi:O-antigen ligase family protein [Pontibacter sp. JAM-7]|uniref:O-antigen ligase family protein n=1 Tax=Pontibacter sp. JAM-7 TaxID=3366581 RepID=UPI003AF73507
MHINQDYLFWRKDLFFKLIFGLNSLLVFWFLANSIVGNKSPATSLLLLCSLLFLIPSLKKIPQIWSSQKWWIISLFAFGLFHLLHLWAHAVPLGDDYDKPAKAVAAVFIFLYLLRYGFSHQVVGIAIAIAALAAGGYAIYEKFILELPRAGTMTNPIRYGYLVITVSLICFFYIGIYKNRWFRLLFLMAGCVGAVGAYATGTRGIALILLAVILFLIWQVLRRGYISRLKLVMLITVFISVLVLIAANANIFDRAVKRTQMEVQRTLDGNLNTGVGHRLQMWHTALYLGVSEPLTGAGTDYVQIRQKASAFIEQHGYDPGVLVRYGHFHNQYLDAFAKQGIPGVIVWCLLLAGALIGMRTRYRYAVLIIVATLAVGGLTEAVLRSSRLFYLMVIGISIFRCLDYFEWEKGAGQFSLHNNHCIGKA